MLKLASNGGAVINTDDFYIYKKSNGLDELIFNLSIYDENYPNIVEESVIEYEQPYLVKAIDGGGETAKIKCQIDLDELKATLNIAYTNNSATLQSTITNVLPDGWTLMDESGISIKRTVEGAYTPYDVIMECPETYGIVIRFDAKNRIVHTYDPTKFQPLGAFVSRDLNLKEINYKGKSTEFYTRLYAYGKDGLSFADINDGKPYVDCNTYTDKVICAYWQDDRYEVAENLLEDAQATVDAAGVPQRSYECTVYDLAKTNPDMYGFETFTMFSVVKLIDDVKEVALDYQVVELWEYPYYPEKNIVTLSSATPKIQNTVQSISNEINNPASKFWAGLTNAINIATSLITGENGGYVVINLNDQGKPYEILIMDTPDISTATNVWRWNQAGLGHSSNGYDGPYETAITQDGQIVASFITSGTLSANLIKGGILSIGGTDNGNGIIEVYDENGNKIGEWDNTGATITGDLEIVKNSTIFGISNMSAMFTQLTVQDATDVTRTRDGFVFNETDTDGYSGELMLVPYLSKTGYGSPPVYGVSSLVQSKNSMIIRSGYENGVNLLQNSVILHSEGTGTMSGSKIALSINPSSIRVNKTLPAEVTNPVLWTMDSRGNTYKFTGALSVTGSKSRLVDTENYGNRLLYCYEMASPMFGDIGEAVTDENGECLIYIDDIFSETISPQIEYQVFVQKEGTGDLWVESKTNRWFLIKGSSNLKFSWEIKCKQKEYEYERIDHPYEPESFFVENSLFVLENDIVNYFNEMEEFLYAAS